VSALSVREPALSPTKFCGECGTRLAAVCSSCGASDPSTSRFCGDCGAPLGASPSATAFASPRSYTPPHLAEKILTAKGALEGERKQVTGLFADLVGSTALADRVGAEAMHALLSRFFELALAEVHRYEGTIYQFLGDGFMALFGALEKTPIVAARRGVRQPTRAPPPRCAPTASCGARCCGCEERS
jgi:hypothetical protein